MDRVFSVGEISDQFWSPPPPPPSAVSLVGDPKMNRSASEWAFQRYLQEASTLSDTSSSKSAADSDVVEIKDVQNKNNSNNSNISSKSPVTASLAPGSAGITIDSDEYHAFLKSKLNMACAAVALTRAPFVINHSSSGAVESATQASVDSQPSSRPPSKEYSFQKVPI